MNVSNRILWGTSKLKKVAVIGAGISGLGAAYLLQKNGYEVTVFEKGQIPGGRMITLRQDQYQWDAGAQFMVESYDAMKELMRELGLLQEITYTNPFQSIAVGDHHIYRFRSYSLKGLLQHPRLDLESKLKLMKVMLYSRKHRKCLIFEKPELLAEIDNDRSLSWWRNLTTEKLVDWVINVPTSTLFFWLEDETPWYYALFLADRNVGRIFTPNGGMGSVPEELGKRLNIKYGVSIEAVEAIGPLEVRVTYSNSNGQQAQFFNHVIVATPAPISF